MRFPVIYRYVGFILLLNAAALLLSAGVSLIYGEMIGWLLLYCALIGAIFGAFPLVFVPRAETVSDSEGLIIVVTSWLCSCLLGTLPYLMWGGEFTLINAWFESVSGFTTTGSSILTDIESLPRGLLFWRSITHWLGGMGIIVFAISIMGDLGPSTRVLYQSEMSGLAMDTFRQRARQAARVLTRIYVGLTVLESGVLLLCGMGLFDAVTHAFGTIATGGFSPRNASIAAFDSLAIEGVIMVFMIASGVHFALLFGAATGAPGRLLRTRVLWYYLGAMAAGIAIATAVLYGDGRPFAEALRHGAFQILSVGTSTGYATTDSAVWPPLAQILLVFFSLQCACAGSTSGGIKADRVVLFGKSIIRHLRQLQHPHAVIPIRLGSRPIDDTVVSNSILYIAVYLLVVAVAATLLVALATPPLEAFTGTVAAMGNVGPGLGEVGSLGNYHALSGGAKLILTVVMLLGRLEIYAFIILFLPRYWKRAGAF